MALTDKLTAIGDAIRTHTEATELIPLAEMPNEIHEVYNKGKQAEYDKFWDAYQDNGARTNYAYAFQGAGWSENTFLPKYPISTASGYDVFRTAMFSDFKQHCIDNGIVIDLTQTTTLENCFYDCQRLTSVPDVFGNIPKLTSLVRTFYSCKKLVELPIINSVSCKNANRMCDGCSSLVTVHGIDFTSITADAGNIFSACGNLQNLTINGEIRISGFSFSYCTKLTHDSLMSIINALKNFTDGTTRTVTLGATNLAKLTDEEKAIATQKGWTLA